jgi:hypothetical protein
MLKIYSFVFACLSASFYVDAQPVIGTSTFIGNVGTIAASGASPKSGTVDGWTFTIFSAATCAITNAVGNLNLISTPTGSGFWQSASIKSSNSSNFKLLNFNFHVLTASFVGLSINVAGYRAGASVTGATATSPIITTTGLTSTVNVDVSSNVNFSNIDELRLTPSAGTAQGTFGLEDITIASAVPLPVTWNGPVTASMVTGYPVVRWSIATQENNNAFVVERSADDHTYSAISTVPQTTEADYSFTDRTAPPGTQYYRIKQVDIDGKSTYSNTASVKIPAAMLIVYPNPVTNKLTVTNVKADDLLKLTNISGQVLLIQRGAGSVEMNLSGLPAGLYLLTSQQERKTIRIVKQ